MGMKLYSEASVQAIADAIRNIDGDATLMKIADMPDRIAALAGRGGVVITDTTDAGGGTIRTITSTDEFVGKTSADLTVSNGTVTAPAGYYVSDASKTIPSGSASTPATSITANPTISVSSSGLITATTSASKSVTPSISAGYVSSGTAGTISVSGSNTSQLSTQAAATITPSTSQQTAVAAGKYTTGAVVVAAMPSGTAGTPTATKGSVSNHSISVTPSVTNTTGYITGGTKTGTAVTVTASELVSGNKSITDNGTNIDVTNYATVSVALTFVTYYTGSSTPSSSTGSDGDIYLKVVT